jgi:hypothetical protein
MTVMSSSRNRLEASDSRSREWDWHRGYFDASQQWQLDTLTQAGGFRLGRRTYAVFAAHTHPPTPNDPLGSSPVLR